MQRRDINILRRIVHLVGLISKIKRRPSAHIILPLVIRNLLVIVSVWLPWNFPQLDQSMYAKYLFSKEINNFAILK